MNTEEIKTKRALAELKKAAAEMLASYDSFIILTHRNPDGDAIGSTAAMILTLLACGKKPVALINEIKGAETRFIAEGVEDQIVYGETPGVIPGENDLVVLLDCANADRVDKCFSELVKNAPHVIKIDHHLDTGDAAGYDLDVTDPDAAATCELLYDILFSLAGKYGSAPGKDVALKLYTGIMTDSGRFTYSCTTGNTMRTVGALLDVIDGDVSWISKKYYDIKPVEDLRLLGIALLGTQLFAEGQVAVLAVRDEYYLQAGGKPGDIGYIIPELMNIEGVRIAAVIKSADEGDPREFRVSMRSTEEYSVADICRALGGGGHKCAAGATVFCDTIDEAFETVKGLCIAAIEGETR